MDKDINWSEEIYNYFSCFETLSSIKKGYTENHISNHS